MDIKLLKTDIMTCNIPKFLIFVADEPALARQYINSISTTLNIPCKYNTSADSVIVDSTSIVNKHCDNLDIIYNDQAIIKNINYIDNLINLNKYIIVYFDAIDKSCDLYNKYKEYFVFFNKLDKYTILAYLTKILNKNKISVDQNKLITLIDYCDCSLGCCLNELDKIITLGQENSNVLFDYMLNNGFSDYRQTNVFKFVNHLLDKDPIVFEELEKLVDSPMTLLYNIYNTARNRFIKTHNPLYSKLMRLSSKYFNSIVDGSISDCWVLRHIMLEVFK